MVGKPPTHCGCLPTGSTPADRQPTLVGVCCHRALTSVLSPLGVVVADLTA